MNRYYKVVEQNLDSGLDSDRSSNIDEISQKSTTNKQRQSLNSFRLSQPVIKTEKIVKNLKMHNQVKNPPKSRNLHNSPEGKRVFLLTQTG